MKKNITLLALLLFAVSHGAFAQRMIFGKVIDANDESGIPGVNIIVKGIPVGTTTDIDGNFVLRVPNDATTIVISFTGYKTIEMAVENQTQFDITLQTDVNVLGDVVVRATRNLVIPPERAVVTALGIVRDKKTLTFSTQTVSGEEINRASDPNPIMSLRDRTPGLNANFIEQGPGAKVVAMIRGRTSWNHSSPPLLVVDGIPWGVLSGNTFGGDGASSRLSLINPDQIESITVLRSANASMLYGNQAANGAIVITLKK